MKTKVFTVIGALLIGMAVFAQNKETNCEFDVQLTDNQQVVVRQTNANGMEIKVRVYNNEGVRINSKKFTCTGNLKAIYDLSNLNQGDIKFEIVCQNKIVYAEQLTKMADGTLSIPKAIPLNELNPKNSNAILFTNK